MEDAQLTFKTEDAAIDIGNAELDAGIVDQIAGGEIICPVNHNIPAFAKDGQGIFRCQRRVVFDNLNIGIQIEHSRGGAVQFGKPDRADAVNHLTLQIGEIHHIVIDQSNAPDASRRQIKRQRAAQAARANQQDAGCLEAALPFHADFGHNHMTAVAFDLIVGQMRQSVVQGGHILLSIHLSALGLASASNAGDNA